MAKKPAAFKDWVGNVTSSRGLKAAHLSWPKGALDEIAEVIRMNDAGESNVSAQQMIARLRDAWGVTATRHQLETFLFAKGRRSWRVA